MIEQPLSSIIDQSLSSNSTIADARARQRESKPLPLITIFAIPKPFTGDTIRIQKNAIRSWARLSPLVEVLLIGDELGIEEAAQELGVRWVGGLERNRHGTPLVSSAFEIAARETGSPLLAYCNCDVILLKNFARTLQRLAESECESFVAFGRRTDLAIDRELQFQNPTELETLLIDCQQLGTPSTIVCKEYFAFRRGTYSALPPFAVGRGNWDNWMIHFAKRNQIPVVDVSSGVTAIHQAHDYSHTGTSRWQCYVGGDEARENERLAGGRHWISGSTPTHRLNDQGLQRVRLHRLNLSFWFDGFRFLRLVQKLWLGR